MKSKSECTPVQSLAFAKTHKAGSTTLQNIILRYGYLRDLTFAIPAWKGWMFDQTRSFNASTLVRRYVNNPGLEFVKRMSSEESNNNCLHLQISPKYLDGDVGLLAKYKDFISTGI